MSLSLINFLISACINWLSKNNALFIIFNWVFTHFLSLLGLNFDIVFIFLFIQIENLFAHLINWCCNGIVLCFEGLEHGIIFLTASKHVIVHIFNGFHCLLKLIIFSFQVIKGPWLNRLFFIHFLLRFFSFDQLNYYFWSAIKYNTLIIKFNNYFKWFIFNLQMKIEV